MVHALEWNSQRALSKQTQFLNFMAYEHQHGFRFMSVAVMQLECRCIKGRSPTLRYMLGKSKMAMGPF